VNARAAVDAAFGRADEVGAWHDGLNILLSGSLDDARAAADAAPATGLLAGMPIVLKDNIATTALPTTCGSHILEGYISPYEATVTSRVRAAGGIVIAKSNMDEFAMGSSTEHSAYGPARNPLDPARVCGGSSGGSAAAVAAGIVRIALGSETGGSVRQPAAFCGVVGVKPTYGRVSRFGLVAFASSLDQVGVVGRTVEDAARGLQAIAGVDPHDATTVDVPVGDYIGAATDRLDGVVIGVPREAFPDSLDARVRERCDAALHAFRAAGATVRDVSLPNSEYAIPVYYIIAPAECSSNLARFDGVRYGLRIVGDGLRGMYEATRSRGFGAEVTRRILLGTYVLSHGYYDAYYRKAQAVRTLIAADFARTFADGVHALFTPTTPTPAFELGAITDPYEMYLSDIYTVTANLAGIPGISVPIGRLGALPVGGQLLAPHFGEETMFRLAYTLERAGLAEQTS
jgi:aspartyl-tRNA(Asn)/glutamyl-tRNA(Gln) amidotransferase subunit A